MIASLPMYDRPETRAATDGFWAEIRDGLRAAGIAAPDALTRSGAPLSDWRDPGLVLSQSCSLPYRALLVDVVKIVAAPVYAIACPPGQTYSVIVAAAPSLPDRPRLAINDGVSQSGWAAAYDWTRSQNVTPESILETGSHIASAQAIAEGRADFAAIDAQSWHFMRRYDTFAGGLVELDVTPPTPMQPYITRPDLSEVAMAQALEAAYAALPETTRAQLNLQGVVQVDPAAYTAMDQPPKPQDVAALLC